MAIGLSHGGTTIYSSPSRSNEVLVGTREGIAIIAREGSAWQVAHRALTDRHISAIIIEPESGLTIAGAFHGSVHVSADGGRTWEPRGNGLTQTNVYSLASARVDGHARLYAGTEPAHLFVSPEDGTTWEQWTGREDEIGGYPDGFVFCPSDPKLIFMTAAQDVPGTWRTTHFAGARISRSRDGGRSWEILHNGLPDRLQASIEAFCLEESGNSPSIFAATTSGEVFCSEDLGKHWEKIISGLAPISKAGHYRNLIAA